MKVEVHNDTIKGEDTPGTLSLMYHYMCRYAVMNKNTKSNYSAASATLGEVNDVQKPRNGKQSKAGKFGAANKSGCDKKANSGKDNSNPKPKRDLPTVKCWESAAKWDISPAIALTES